MLIETIGTLWCDRLVLRPFDDKQRFVPVSDACVDALRAHWCDRGENFDAADADGPLVAPTVVPPTPRAREKFGAPGDAGDQVKRRGYSVRGARGLTQWAIAQLLEVMPDLSEAERRKRASMPPAPSRTACTSSR